MQIFHTDIHAALVTMQGIGIDVFGINCSIGPDLMEKTVEKLSRYSHLPISVIPNAGLPMSVDGKTVFKFPPEEFAAIQRKFVDQYGINVVGGCCGTTAGPEAESTVSRAGALPLRTAERRAARWIEDPHPLWRTPQRTRLKKGARRGGE